MKPWASKLSTGACIFVSSYKRISRKIRQSLLEASNILIGSGEESDFCGRDNVENPGCSVCGRNHSPAVAGLLPIAVKMG